MIWCSYAHRGRSKMSKTITNTWPRAIAKSPRREPRPSAQRAGSRHAHLAEQAYAAELAHAERAHASARRPARERAPVRALRALRSVRSSAAEADGAGAPEPSRSERRRWLALAVLCLGQLMMV